MNIGLFDSGIGGLTVLTGLIRKFPGHNYLYFADYANLPYGSKPYEHLKKLVLNGLNKLRADGAEIIVSACNTGDAVLDGRIEENFSMPYYSIVKAGAKAVKDYSKIAVITTDQTMKTGVYIKEILKLNNGAFILQKSASLFVSLVEEGIWNGKMADAVVKYYLEDVKRWKPQVLLLGCTHYPFLQFTISSFMKDVVLLDPAEKLLEELERVIPPGKGTSKVRFLVTGNVERFQTLVNLVQHHPLGNGLSNTEISVEKVVIREAQQEGAL